MQLPKGIINPRALLAFAWLLLPAPEITAQFTLFAIGQTNVGGHAEGVAVAGNYLYLANGEDGLRIFEVSNPSTPIAVGHTNDGGYARAVAVSSNFVYLANDTNGVVVYDVTDPFAPVGVATNSLGGAAQRVAVGTNLVFVANGTNGLGIHRSSDLARLGLLTGNGSAQGVASAGNYAYVADGSAGLVVVDVSDPAHPSAVLANQPDPYGFAGAVALDGTHAYLANGNDGLRIYDLSNPASPTNVGHGANRHGLLNSASVAEANGFAYVTDGLLGLSVYDVFTPTTPTNFLSVSTGGFAADVAVGNNCVYLAYWDEGLLIYQIVPQLYITATTTNSLLISWTTAILNGSLEQTSDLTSTNWTTISPPLSLIGHQYQALIAPTPPSPAFYRLRIR
jgi:hypothetical protein